jgi:hypothetical protein
MEFWSCRMSRTFELSSERGSKKVDPRKRDLLPTGFHRDPQNSKFSNSPSSNSVTRLLSPTYLELWPFPKTIFLSVYTSKTSHFVTFDYFPHKTFVSTCSEQPHLSDSYFHRNLLLQKWVQIGGDKSINFTSLWSNHGRWKTRRNFVTQTVGNQRVFSK